MDDVSGLRYPCPDLASGLVHLRPWHAEDLACVAAASGDRRITESTTVPADFSAVTGREWISRQHSRLVDGQGWSLAIAEPTTDRAVGCTPLTLRAQSGVAGIGYWIAPDERGRGLATDAVKLITQWGVTSAGLQRIEAWVEPDNVGSIKTLKAAGYVEEGRLRSFLGSADRRADALVFSRVPDEPL